MRDDTKRKGRVEAATPKPCVDCPWRTENHGRRHADGWFTKANRARLWARLRRGEAMTCHRTDPDNPVPDGYRTVPETATTHLCAGAEVLQQREVMKLQAIGGDVSAYRRRWPRGLTTEGLRAIVVRHLYGGVPMVGGVPLGKVNLDEPGVSAGDDVVGSWEELRADGTVT